MHIREILKGAVLDQKIEGLNFLNLNNKKQISQVLRNYPTASYISVWEYGIGKTWLEYHVHNEERGKELERLYNTKKRGGHPLLAGVYSREFLESASANESPSAQGIERTLH